jgi:hypothetical protein
MQLAIIIINEKNSSHLNLREDKSENFIFKSCNKNFDSVLCSVPQHDKTKLRHCQKISFLFSNQIMQYIMFHNIEANKMQYCL